MRSLRTLAAPLLLFCLTGSGLTQQYGGYGCYAPGGCPGYGPCAASQYRGPLPPYLMGGPAYGYTYPYPWYGYCPYPPGPRSYIAPPYYPMAYQPSVQTHSFYSPAASYYPYYPMATVKSNASPAAREASAKPKQYLPGKEPAASAPPAASESAKQPTAPPASTKRSSLWRRLLYW